MVATQEVGFSFGQPVFGLSGGIRNGKRLHLALEGIEQAADAGLLAAIPTGKLAGVIPFLDAYKRSPLHHTPVPAMRPAPSCPAAMCERS